MPPVISVTVSLAGSGNAGPALLGPRRSPATSPTRPTVSPSGPATRRGTRPLPFTLPRAARAGAGLGNRVIRRGTGTPPWGPRGGEGGLAGPGHRLAASTVWQILRDAGSDPAPRRAGPTWKQFLTTQARGILAADFVHVDTVLLRRIHALIVIEHDTRQVHLAGRSEERRVGKECRSR